MKKWLTRIGVLAIVGYVLLCVVLYFGQDFILFHPSPLEDNYKVTFDGVEAEELFITADDDTPLSTVLVHTKRDTARGIVVFSHGNTGNIQTCGYRHRFFTERGFDFLIWDYRTYGKTRGSRTEKTFYSDALNIYDWAAAHYDEDKILVYGQSLGSGMAIYMAANASPKRLVLEAPYYSILDVAIKKYPFIPGFICRFPLRSDQYIPKVQCPIDVFHGTNDASIDW